jgi:acyl dehydratase
MSANTANGAAKSSGLTASDVKAGDPLPTFPVDVNASTVILGALASRDWRPMHHDRDFAIHRNGTRDIFMNTPNQAAWFERYVTDWTGPKGRLARLKFRMKDSVYPGDTMEFTGRVDEVETDDVGCTFVRATIDLKVGDRVVTQCTARVAVPAAAGDNPWSRSGDRWKP